MQKDTSNDKTAAISSNNGTGGSNGNDGNGDKDKDNGKREDLLGVFQSAGNKILKKRIAHTEGVNRVTHYQVERDQLLDYKRQDVFWHGGDKGSVVNFDPVMDGQPGHVDSDDIRNFSMGQQRARLLREQRDP